MGTVATLRPGLLVSLRTTVTGGVHYDRTTLEKKDDDGVTEIERWETTKIVTDADEVDRASKVRSKASALIRGVCSYSDFGLLCPTANEADLDGAVAKAQALVQEFNAGAKTVRVGIYALKGRIASDDVEATKAIGVEMREIIDEMRGALAKADVKAIREVASRARQLGEMLSPQVQEKVSAAIEGARQAARDMVKQLAAGADHAAVAIVEVKEVEEARFCFLDLEMGSTPVGDALPAIDPRALDVASVSPKIDRPITEQLPLDVQ